MKRSEFGSVDFVFTEIGNLICFQNVSKARLVSKKCILCLGEDFEYKADRREIVINTIPDAIYNKNTDVLYFKRLESITSIFRGIDQLYKEATEEETTQFLENDFIQLKQNYNASKPKKNSVSTKNTGKFRCRQQEKYIYIYWRILSRAENF